MTWDVLLFGAEFEHKDCTEHVVTRPTVGISFKYGRGKYNTKEVERTLDELGCFPVRIDAIPRDVDQEKLAAEVEALTAVGHRMRMPLRVLMRWSFRAVST